MESNPERALSDAIRDVFGDKLNDEDSDLSGSVLYFC